MLHTYLPDNTIKLRFTSIFDDAAVPVITHDFNAKTLRLGPGYSILNENGDPLGAGGGGGISGSGVANQIAYWTDTDEIGGNAGFTFDPAANTPLVLSLSAKSGQGLNILWHNPTDAMAASSGLLIYADNTDAMASLTGIQAASFAAEADAGTVAAILGLNIFAANYSSNTTAQLLGAFIEIDGADVTDLVGLKIQSDSAATGTDHTGVLVGNITGATNNYAIKTGAGDIRLGELAGSGTRYVYVDDDGKLVAGAAV